MTMFAGPLNSMGELRRVETLLTTDGEPQAWRHMVGRFTIPAHWCADEPAKLKSKNPMVGQDDWEGSSFTSAF